MTLRRAALLAIAVLVPGAAHAQPCPASASAAPPAASSPELGPVPRALLGGWEGTGTLMGRPAIFAMRWTRALDDRFLRLAFENAMVGPDGDAVPVLSATAFYRVGEGPMTGSWADTRGALLTLCGRVSDGALVVDWSGSGENGRTTYRPRADGTVQVADSVEAASGWRAFGTAIYRRAGAPEPGAVPSPHPAPPR